MPSLPALYFDIREQIEDPNSDVAQMAEITARDPSLMGTDTLLGLVLTAHLYAGLPPPGLRLELLRNHTFEVSTLARQITQAQGDNRQLQSQSAVAGLLDAASDDAPDQAPGTLQGMSEATLSSWRELLDELGEVEIAVEGHTDDLQIQGGVFGSTWELAPARSSAVTAFLLQQGLAAEHLRVVSYADARPVADNGTAEGRARNRRVELRVQFPNQQP